MFIINFINLCTEWNFNEIRKTINFGKYLKPQCLWGGGGISYKPKTISFLQSYIVPIIQAFDQ